MALEDAISSLESRPTVLHGLREETVLAQVSATVQTMQNRLETETLALSELADPLGLELRPVHTDYLPPDISYHLDCSCSFGHIMPDTEHFVRYICDDPVDLIENGLGGPGGLPANQTWLEHLRDRDRNLETAYLRWRAQNREAAALVSVAMWSAGTRYIEHLVEAHARDAVNDGLEKIVPNRFGGPHRRLCEDMRVYRRAFNRMKFDLAGLSRPQILAQKRKLWGLNTRHAVELPSKKKLRAVELRKLKKTVQRSIRFLQSLLGDEPVRLFLGDNDLIVRGTLCDFALRREGHVLSKHSHGTGCRILAKDGRFVARLCIFSENVPLLDHVASLIMHVRSGLEETVLRSGNWYAIDRVVLRTLPELAALNQGRLSDRLDDDFDMPATEIDNSVVHLGRLGRRSMHQILGTEVYEQRLANLISQIKSTLPEEWFIQA